jgi:hypothetical protein
MNNRFTSALFVLFALLLATCEKPERDNPWDEKNTLNPEAWAPQNFQVEDVTITEKKLTWSYDGDDRIEGFKLDRKKGDEPWQVGYQAFSKETRTWNDTEIIPGPSLIYEYRLYAYAGKNKSAEKSESIAVDFPPPTNLQLEKLSDISYKLIWQDNSTGEEGFKIDRKTADSVWDIGYGTVGPNETSFVDTNVFVGKSTINVEYRVYAIYKEYESAKTTANTNAALTPPTDLTITQNTITSVTLNWQDNSNGEEGFRIMRKYGEEKTDVVPISKSPVDGRMKSKNTDDWEEIGTTTGNSFEDNNFEFNVQVNYQVYAFVEEYNSDFAENSFDATIPPPTNLQITQNTITSVTLNWQYNSNGEEGFKIERRFGTGDWEELAITTGTSWQDNDFELNTMVYYRVYAYFGNYASAYSESNFDATIPPPTNLQITQNTITSVTLNWQYNSNGEEGFKIERRFGTGDWEELAITTVTSWQDNDFELNTMVYYRLSAYYNEYTSGWVENTFDSSIPPPENLTITANSATSVTLNWSYDLTGHEGFKIDRKVDNGNWEFGFAILNFGTVIYNDNSVDLLEHSYYYRVYTYVDEFISIKKEVNQEQIQIGSFIFGGIVFYLDGNGGGLVCAESDHSTFAKWGCFGTSIGGTGLGIGTGAANTTAIIAGCGESGIAARICNDLVLNGYSDWFLPSKDELNLMYQNLKLAGIGGFADYGYWSSSEYWSTTAWLQDFGDGTQYANGYKDYYERVRAVRAF